MNYEIFLLLVDGKFSDWFLWLLCLVMCGIGMKNRICLCMLFEL